MSRLKAVCRYAQTLLVHKWFFMFASIHSGFYLRAFTHDLDKLLPRRFWAYAMYWGRPGRETTSGEIIRYLKESERHLKGRKHHPEHWLKPGPDGKEEPTPMQDTSVFEMINDWRAAGLAYKGTDDSREYFKKVGHSLPVHPETLAYLEDFYEVHWNPIAQAYVDDFVLVYPHNNVR